MMNIRPIEPRDVAACVDIYNFYIANTAFSFEEKTLTAEQFAVRVERISRDYAWLVAETEEGIIGYTYLDRFAERSAYRYTVDLSIYIKSDCRSQGVGKALFAEIERKAKEMGYKQMISLVTGENTVSQAFHRSRGFTQKGEITDVGFKFNRWHNILYFQKGL